MLGLDLLGVCIIAIVSVFSLLSILSLIIKLTIIIFPEKVQTESDQAFYASIYSTYATNFPNMKITKIEEVL